MSSTEAPLTSALLRWTDHVICMDESRLMKNLLYRELREGTRYVGSPILRYKDQIKRYLK